MLKIAIALPGHSKLVINEDIELGTEIAHGGMSSIREIKYITLNKLIDLQKKHKVQVTSELVAKVLREGKNFVGKMRED